MKHLISLFKDIEIELRSSGGKINDKGIWTRLSNLSDWEYRIAQDFILRVRMAINSGDISFVFRYFEKEATKEVTTFFKNNVDILIAVLKRDQHDVALTDAWNRLLIPAGLTSRTIEIWGLPVTRARNFAVEQALLYRAKYLLFIDDDILAPNNGLLKLYRLISKTNAPAVSGLYYKKIEPLEAPFEADAGQIIISEDEPIQEVNKICGMGFCLIDIDRVSQNVPQPLFWEFGAPDGYWSLGEDAFFTQNVFEYMNEPLLVDTSIKCLHIDKMWKKIYGERDNEVVYAGSIVDDLDKFNRMRVPPKHLFILICIPTRRENDPIAVDLGNLLMYRGYRAEVFRVWGLNVDEARQRCAEEALNRGADYLLFIDDDIIPPKDGLNRLLDISEQGYAVTSGNYYLKGSECLSAHTQLNDRGVVTAVNRIDDLPGQFISNWLIGLGFCLINTNIFRQARKPWFKCYSTDNHTDNDINEDAHFCELCLDNGYQIMVDKTIECLHVDFAKRKVYGVFKDIEYATYQEILDSFELINFNNEG